MKPEKLKMISPQELREIMGDKDIFLVDVHVPEQSHIIGTDFFIPFYKIKQNINKFPLDKNTSIYLYCESGPMGNAAARTLFDLEYINIYNLKKGTKGWEEAGFNLK